MSERNSNDDEVTIVESNPNRNKLKHFIWLNQLRWWFIWHTQPSCPIKYLHYAIIHTLYLLQGWVPSIGDHWTLPCSFSSLLAPQHSVVVLFLLGITYAKQKIWHMYWEKKSHMTNDTSGSNKNHWWGCGFAYEIWMKQQGSGSVTNQKYNSSFLIENMLFQCESDNKLYEQSSIDEENASLAIIKHGEMN